MFMDVLPWKLKIINFSTMDINEVLDLGIYLNSMKISFYIKSNKL